MPMAPAHRPHSFAHLSPWRVVLLVLATGGCTSSQVFGCGGDEEKSGPAPTAPGGATPISAADLKSRQPFYVLITGAITTPDADLLDDDVTQTVIVFAAGAASPGRAEASSIDPGTGTEGWSSDGIHRVYALSVEPDAESMDANPGAYIYTGPVSLELTEHLKYKTDVYKPWTSLETYKGSVHLVVDPATGRVKGSLEAIHVVGGVMDGKPFEHEHQKIASELKGVAYRGQPPTR